MKQLVIASAACFLLLSSCSQNAGSGAIAILPPAANVTRSEALSISKVYTSLVWTPRRSNVLHGKDPDGIVVQTPDKAPNDTSSHFWVVGRQSRGMPYQWGGFDTPQQFITKTSKKSRPAGDMATLEKVEQGDELVSKYAAGIDCSGFISRCWRLDRPYSTRELPALCTRLNSYRDLQAGDILIIPGNHVVMFIRWGDTHQKAFIGSEAVGNVYHRVVLGDYRINRFIEKGFVPMRYKNMRP